MSAFGGASVRLPLGGAQPARASARLLLTTSHTVHDWRSGDVQTFKSQGIEFGATASGRGAVYLGGRSAAEVERELGVRVSRETTYYIIGAVVLSALVIAFLATHAPSSPGG